MQGGEELNLFFTPMVEQANHMLCYLNIVHNISSVSNGLQTKLGVQVALSYLAKRAIHINPIKNHTYDPL